MNLNGLPELWKMPFKKKMEDAIWKNKNALAKQLLGWEPKTAFRDGF
jgi:hypothetical protein